MLPKIFQRENPSCCPGVGKIRAAKIGGTGMIPNGYPALRQRTQATWNKTMQIHRDWPLDLTEVDSPAGNKESTTSFWQANFSGAWT